MGQGVSGILSNILDAYWLDGVRADNALEAKQKGYVQRQSNISDLLSRSQPRSQVDSSYIQDKPTMYQPPAADVAQGFRNDKAATHLPNPDMVAEDNKASKPFDYNMETTPYKIPRVSNNFFDVASPGQLAEFDTRLNGGSTMMQNMQNNRRSLQETTLKNINQQVIEKYKHTTPAAVSPSANRGYGVYRKQGGSKNIEQYLKGLASSGASRVNVRTGNESYIKPNTVLMDKEGNKVSVPVGMTMGEARKRGLNYGKNISDEYSKSSASMDVSRRMLDDLQKMVDSGVDVSGIGGFIEELRSGSDIAGVATNALLSAIGNNIKPENAKMLAVTTSLGNQLLQAMRGAAVGPAEKQDFIKQLPTPGQPPEIFQANIELTSQNLHDLSAMRKQSITGVKDNAQKMPDFDNMSEEELKSYLAE